MPTAWSATVNRSRLDRLEDATLNALAVAFVVATVVIGGPVVIALLSGGAL